MIRYAVTTGNWNVAATWDGGASIPGNGDYVYANGFTVYLNVNINIGTGTISTEVCPTTGIGGGTFEYRATRTIVANIVAGLSDCVFDGTATNNSQINVIGDISGSINGFGLHHMCNTAIPNSEMTITGNVGPKGIFIRPASNSSKVYIYITGNITSSLLGNAIMRYSGSVSVTVVVIVVVGNITANTTEFIDTGLFNLANVGNVNITGICEATNSINIVNTQILTLTGKMIGYGGQAPFVARQLYLSPTEPTAIVLQDTNGDDISLYTSNYFTGIPSIGDVREGIVYGLPDNLTGTLAVPSPSNVASGVPTDDTVGTADFAMSAVLTAIGVVNEGVQKASKLIPHSTDI